MILRYSDLKGRTDLVGRKVRAVLGKLNPCGQLRDDGSNTAEITRMDDTHVWINECRHALNGNGFLELLDEEPCEVIPLADFAHQDKIYTEKISMEEFNEKFKKDTRTEITWKNFTLEDKVRGIYSQRVFTVREWLEDSVKYGFELIQPDGTIKMTISQIEEKLGHKVQIVE